MSKVNLTTNETSKETGKVFLLDKLVCNYIRDNWIDQNKPIEPQSKELGIHRHIITKILSEDGYGIPLATLSIMCFYKGISLSDFFKIIEKKHEGLINDHFITKTKRSSLKK